MSLAASMQERSRAAAGPAGIEFTDVAPEKVIAR
jgi:hypothetical protein